MRVAIITFQRTGSYGAVLQMYSLQSALKSIPHVECKVIDYQNDTIENVYKPIRLTQAKSIKDIAKMLLLYHSRKKNWTIFNDFIEKNIELSDKVTDVDIDKYADCFDIYIAGSDQIWHTGMNGHNYYYFLDFVSNPKKKFSYAASFGQQTLPQNEIEAYKKLLFDYKAISVREKDIVPTLENLLNREIEISPDPTLLHDARFWKDKAVSVHNKKPYVLVYTVLDPINLYSEAEKLAKKESLDILVINGNRRNTPKGSKIIMNIDPFAFLGYIKGAKYILTNSFHATVFSILFHQKFAVELKQKFREAKKIEYIYNNRIANLLELIGLDKKTAENGIVINNIDWSAVDKKLNLVKEKGWAYINEIIKNAEKRK